MLPALNGSGSWSSLHLASKFFPELCANACMNNRLPAFTLSTFCTIASLMTSRPVPFQHFHIQLRRHKCSKMLSESKKYRHTIRRCHCCTADDVSDSQSKKLLWAVWAPGSLLGLRCCSTAAHQAPYLLVCGPHMRRLQLHVNLVICSCLFPHPSQISCRLVSSPDSSKVSH